LQLNGVFDAFFQSNGLHSTYSAEFAGKRSGYGTIAASESERSGKVRDFASVRYVAMAATTKGRLLLIRSRMIRK
jgi:hypothetical protein